MVHKMLALSAGGDRGAVLVGMLHGMYRVLAEKGSIGRR